MPDIWARLPTEPPIAFDVFRRYRDMPAHGRSLDAVANELRGTTEAPICPSGRRRRTRTRRIQHWSIQWRWVERAAAWDAHVDAEVQRRLIEAAVEMAHRHATAARAIQERAVRRLIELDPAELTPADVLRWMLAGCKLEAQSMETLARLASGADEAASIAGDADTGPGVIMRRSDSSVPMAQPEPAALPFVPAAALAG